LGKIDVEGIGVTDDAVPLFESREAPSDQLLFDKWCRDDDQD